MPGAKGLSPHELAHMWVKDLRTRPDMSIKVKRKLRDMRILGQDCESAKHETIRVVSYTSLLIPTNCNHFICIQCGLH